jgi:hypothetical protein
MVKTMEKHEENLTSSRDKLFERLDHVLDVCNIKFNLTKTSNATKQKWARLIISAVQTYAKLLDGVETEKLLKRLDEIEDKMGVKK